MDPIGESQIFCIIIIPKGCGGHALLPWMMHRAMGVSGKNWGQWTYRLLLMALLLGNGWVQYILWFGDQGLVAWRGTVNDLMEVRQEETRIRERLQRLEEEVYYLDKDPHMLEEVARRELGLVYPDEILFVMPETSKTPP